MKDVNINAFDEDKTRKRRRGKNTLEDSPRANHRQLDLIRLFREIPQKIPFVGSPSKRTVSVALPASLVYNVQTDELRAYIIGNIARIVTIYGIHEVIIYNDLGNLRIFVYFQVNKDQNG
ncbi:bifunctional tRNA (guanine-N1-)-methyltransferase [Babesia duncani]|uniref:Bifunctional tRNA (Guanine-N1-)-methyltransferase n=1 Tax=Babesia duncani TaxID=323732 RepID=A0AAD9PM57_9APIC|nr:bifunctional tRNA (guanine-N1-)-methyltransferase [Babesia duncani]